MIRVLLKQARPGMKLARTLADPHRPEAAILERGEELTPDVIAALHEAGVYDLWIQDMSREVVEEGTGHSLSAAQQRLCEIIRQGITAAAQRAAVTAHTAQMRDIIRALMQTLMTSNLPCVQALANADEHVISHGAEVCYTALLIAMQRQEYIMGQRKRGGWMEAKDFMNLGLGCLFHDVGDGLLPEMEREYRRIESSASTGWQKHVELGFNAVRNQLEPSAAAVVLHHHQHFDGSGFPRTAEKGAPAGEAIHVFSRIAFVADTFVHFLKHDSIPMPTVHALWRLQHPTCRGWCDPEILQGLLEVMTPFLPGMVVQLSDRRHGVVTRTFEDAPCYPEVQTLATEPAYKNEQAVARERVGLGTGELWVQSVDGIDVTGFLYGGREAGIERRKTKDERRNFEGIKSWKLEVGS